MCTTFLLHEIPKMLEMEGVAQDNNHNVINKVLHWLDWTCEFSISEYIYFNLIQIVQHDQRHCWEGTKKESVVLT